MNSFTRLLGGVMERRILLSHLREFPVLNAGGTACATLSAP
jgi:hypothetical protein